MKNKRKEMFKRKKAWQKKSRSHSKPDHFREGKAASLIEMLHSIPYTLNIDYYKEKNPLSRPHILFDELSANVACLKLCEEVHERLEQLHPSFCLP